MIFGPVSIIYQIYHSLVTEPCCLRLAETASRNAAKKSRRQSSTQLTAAWADLGYTWCPRGAPLVPGVSRWQRPCPAKNGFLNGWCADHRVPPCSTFGTEDLTVKWMNVDEALLEPILGYNSGTTAGEVFENCWKLSLSPEFPTNMDTARIIAPTLCYKQELKSVQGLRQRCLQRSFTRCNLHNPPIWPVWIWETNSFRNSFVICVWEWPSPRQWSTFSISA